MAIDSRSIQQAVEGNRSAQEVLYRALVDRVFRLVLRIVGQAHADDVTQEVFVRIFSTLGSFRGQSAFPTWVHRVAVNESLQYLRRIKKHSETISLDANESSFEMTSTPSTVEKIEQHELFEKAYSRLTSEQRALLELREVQQYSYAEIVEILEIPLGTVGSRLNKARSDLQHHLENLGSPHKI